MLDVGLMSTCVLTGIIVLRKVNIGKIDRIFWNKEGYWKTQHLWT